MHSNEPIRFFEQATGCAGFTSEVKPAEWHGHAFLLFGRPGPLYTLGPKNGAALGDRLARVRDRMHTGAAMPVVEPGTPMPEVIHEMSRKRLGIAAVCEGGTGRLLGVISDGDLRRMLEMLMSMFRPPYPKFITNASRL